MLKEYFLNKLKEKYPDNFSKYDYSLVSDEFYNRDKVNIKCLIHGSFQQRFDKHLEGRGCPECALFKLGNKNRIDTKSFIADSIKVHGYKYDYSKVKYINSVTKVIITCLHHGDFEQYKRSHLDGYGCPICAIENKTSNNLEFISKANLKHNHKYNYDKVNYITNKKKIIITCPMHGDFTQAVNDHLKGQGCPKCNESKGEINISRILNKYNIKFIREYKMSGYRYRYDFYLPEYNIYIEYHGKQHYESFKCFGGNKRFIKQQRNDKTKKELIKRSSGLLIIIKYTFSNLEKIESELLRLFTILHPDFFINKDLVRNYINQSKLYLIEDGVCFKRKP